MPSEITVRPSQLRKALQVCIEEKQPAVVWGGPGIGKSDIVHQISKTMELCLKDDRAILKDPVDLRGLPIVNGDGRAHWAIPEDYPRDGRGIWFVDELNRAPVMVQNAYFQLILNRKLGEYEMPNEWAILAACNRESDGGGVNRMPQALANRFIHFDLHVDLDEWCEWAITNGIDPMLVAFLRFKTNLLYMFDPQEKAFPTPRSWAFVNQVLGKTNPELELAMITGAVGQGAATEFISFLKLYRELPDIDKIIKNPETGFVPTEVATLYAVSSAVAARATKDNFKDILTYLNRLPTEYAVYSIKDAILRDQALQMVPEFTKWAVSHASLLK